MPEDRSATDHAGVPVPPPLLYAGGFVAGMALERRRPLPAVPAAVARPLGAVLMLLGGALPASGATLFRRRGTSVLPVRPATALVTSGPYRLTRNPMYIGFALAHAGLALRRRSTWALLMLGPVLASVDRLVIAREERYLERAFGDDYRRYAERVGRWW
jgi:protein-S-isoprenylcysteine O-methyltransferase Ste14